MLHFITAFTYTMLHSETLKKDSGSGCLPKFFNGDFYVLSRAGLSNVHSVHVHRRPCHMTNVQI